MKRNAIVRFYNKNTGEQCIIKEIHEMYVADSYIEVMHIAFDPEEGFYDCVTTISRDIYPNYEFIA